MYLIKGVKIFVLSSYRFLNFAQMMGNNLNLGINVIRQPLLFPFLLMIWRKREFMWVLAKGHYFHKTCCIVNMYISKGVTSMSYLPMACLLCTNDEKFSNFGDEYDKETVKMPLFFWRFEENKDYVISGLGNVISIKHAI